MVLLPKYRSLHALWERRLLGAVRPHLRMIALRFSTCCVCEPYRSANLYCIAVMREKPHFGMGFLHTQVPTSLSPHPIPYHTCPHSIAVAVVVVVVDKPNPRRIPLTAVSLPEQQRLRRRGWTSGGRNVNEVQGDIHIVRWWVEFNNKCEMNALLFFGGYLKLKNATVVYNSD